jgi:hypothetical protein
MEHENAAAIERVSLLIKRARECASVCLCVLCVFEREREKRARVRPSVFCAMGTASESLVRPAAQSLLMMKKNHTPIYTGREEC